MTLRYRRVGILLLVAQFYGLLAAALIVPAVALTISVTEFHASPFFLLLIPYGFFGLLLIRAALPSRLTVRPNGIPRNPTDGPALFELCDKAAKTAGFTKPYFIFVDFSPAASTLRHLRMTGLRSRYVIVLGLPALQMLSEEELLALVIYFFKVFNSISLPETWLKEIRHVLTHQGIEGGWTGGIVKRYVARADALLAAQKPDAPLTARWAVGQAVFKRFWLNDVNPLLQRGFIPPVIEGYVRVLQKIGFMADYPMERPSLSLLRSPWHVEQRIASALGKTRGTGLQPVSWELVPWRVILPSWEELIQPFIPVLSILQVRDVAEFAEHRLLELGRRVFSRPGVLWPPEQLRWASARILAVALALTLRRTGWQLAYEGAGDSWEFRYGLRSLNPFESVDLLASKRMHGDEWIRLCDELGIAQLPLAVS